MDEVRKPVKLSKPTKAKRNWRSVVDEDQAEFQIITELKMSIEILRKIKRTNLEKFPMGKSHHHCYDQRMQRVSVTRFDHSRLLHSFTNHQLIIDQISITSSRNQD